MYEVRDDEPGYAFVPAVETPEINQWGKPIRTLDDEAAKDCKPLEINGETSVSRNDNRFKQHGFHFTADNCIGCHACEAACSEKNNLPAHISFRSVGYVEGGSYPAYKRMNISMACNHCDDPVCLKGCPTRAYTKYEEYGAVIQDPDTCFGCGYCTWVCPYNAPQLDPLQGQVMKCNMCVDRLEVGLKPACASACLGGALDFGLIETTPENREQAKISIPGFPDPNITHPNIRFQQVKSLPKEMSRPDSMPLRYQRDEQGAGAYKAKVKYEERQKSWSLAKLRSREDPLVVFTLITQAVVGAFLLLVLGPLLGLFDHASGAHPVAKAGLLVTMVLVQVYALYTSTMHLGKPHRFYRAFNNLKYSPVSREVAGIAVFFNLLTLYTVLELVPFMFEGWAGNGLLLDIKTVIGWLGALAGPVAIYAMHKIYRIKARPFWNHWQVLTAFFGSVLSLGALTVAVFYVSVMSIAGEAYGQLSSLLASVVFAGLAMEAVGLYFHGKYLKKTGGEAEAAMYEQTTTFGKTYQARNLGLGLGLVAALSMSMLTPVGSGGVIGWMILGALTVSVSLIGRALFYVLVVPTTMPGAFFWRNQGFVEHAREVGLASMPQVGVTEMPVYHHLAMERAKMDIKKGFALLRKEGFKTGVVRLWQAKFSRS